MVVAVGALVASFAIWGINDIFRGFGQNRFATIGSFEIGIEQFRQLYGDRLQQLSRRVGRPITPAQAHELGLDRQILGQLIGEFTFDEQVRRLKLALSDAEIAKMVTANPVFQGPNGQFDRDRFLALIREQNFTEQSYVAQMRREILRRQLTDTVEGGMPAPQAEVEAANRYQNEQRSIEYLALNAAQAGTIPDPTEEDLTRYFEARKGLFRAPEYRKLVVLALTPSELAKWIEVSDADAKREYDERHDRYVTPERRHIQRIVFPTMAEAQAAADRLAQGLTFDALVAERGLKEADVDLGTFTKADMIDPAMANAAFALKEGDTSGPVQGRLSIFIVHVVKVELEVVRPFSEAEAEIKRNIALERAREQILTLHDKVEDAKAAGDTLTEIGQKLKLETRAIEAMDRSGRAPDGSQITLPGGAQIVNAVFTSDVGVDNEPLEVDRGFVWYEVLGITPSRERTLAEVKDQVAARWHDDEVAKRLKAKAADFLGKLNAGQSLTDLASAESLKLETAAGLKRSAATPTLAARVLDEVFKTPKGSAATAAGNSETEQLVFRVTDIVVPTLDTASPETKQLTQAVSASIAGDIITQYLSRLERDIGVDINEAALPQVLGSGS